MPTAAVTQQAIQALIADELVSAIAEHAWPLLDIAHLKDTLPDFTTTVAALVRKYGMASGAAAVRYYEAERVAAGVRGTFAPVPAETPKLDQIDKSIRWATKGLWNKEPDVPAAQTLVDGVAERGALNVGRNTIIRSVHADRKSHGWARITEAGACSFCMLLAIRGAVYRSERTADFVAHDHCRCHVQPLFNVAYEPSAEVRRAKAIYDQASRGAYGPAAVRRAFRDALEADRSK